MARRDALAKQQRCPGDGSLRSRAVSPTELAYRLPTPASTSKRAGPRRGKSNVPGIPMQVVAGGDFSATAAAAMAKPTSTSCWSGRSPPAFGS